MWDVLGCVTERVGRRGAREALTSPVRVNWPRIAAEPSNKGIPGMFGADFNEPYIYLVPGI